MHKWGDEGVDWSGISNAAYFIGKYLKFWGRMSVTCMKEKYGTARVYCMFGWWQFHSIVYPGYVFSQFPLWLWKLDCYYGHYLLRPLNYLVVPFHRWIYRRAYRLAIKKWPHLAGEILTGADFIELLVDLDPRLKIKNEDGCHFICWDE